MQMRFISTILRANDVVKHTNNANCSCEAHKQGQMRFLSTRTNANEIDKYKIMGK